MERIHVSVRARPLSPEEAKTSPWRISGNSIFFSTQQKFDFGTDFFFGPKLLFISLMISSNFKIFCFQILNLELD